MQNECRPPYGESRRSDVSRLLYGEAAGLMYPGCRTEKAAGLMYPGCSPEKTAGLMCDGNRCLFRSFFNI